jgi:hypothetical protein
MKSLEKKAVSFDLFNRRLFVTKYHGVTADRRPGAAGKYIDCPRRSLYNNGLPEEDGAR